MKISKDFKDKVAAFILTHTSQREQVHKLMIESVVSAYTHRDTSHVRYLLDNINSVQGSFRVQAVVYWFEEIAGINPILSDNKYKAKLAKRETDSYDKVQVALCKLAANRFWKIAPSETKIKKLCKIESVFDSAVVQISRSLALDNLTMDEVNSTISGLQDLIKERATDEKVLTWVEEYRTQENIVDSKEELMPTESEAKEMLALVDDSETENSAITETQINKLEQALKS